MTKKELEAEVEELTQYNIEFQKQCELDRVNIHNKLGEPERQGGETLNQYKERIKKAQFIKGYSDTDIILMPWI